MSSHFAHITWRNLAQHSTHTDVLISICQQIITLCINKCLVRNQQNFVIWKLCAPKILGQIAIDSNIFAQLRNSSIKQWPEQQKKEKLMWVSVSKVCGSIEKHSNCIAYFEVGFLLTQIFSHFKQYLVSIQRNQNCNAQLSNCHRNIAALSIENDIVEIWKMPLLKARFHSISISVIVCICFSTSPFSSCRWWGIFNLPICEHATESESQCTLNAVIAVQAIRCAYSIENFHILTLHAILHFDCNIANNVRNSFRSKTIPCEHCMGQTI